MRKCLRENYIGKRIDLCDVKIRISSLIDESEGIKFIIYSLNKVSHICNLPAYDWTCDERMGGGILTLVGSHIIDLLSHLTGLKATRLLYIIQAQNN